MPTSWPKSARSRTKPRRGRTISSRKSTTCREADIPGWGQTVTSKDRAEHEFSQARCRHVAERTSLLFRHSQAQAAEVAQGRAHGGVDRHQCRGMGSDADHAAHGADAACRWFADAGYPEL